MVRDNFTMPPTKKDDKVPAFLDPAKLRKMTQPLAIRVVRLNGDDASGEAIPLENDGRGVSYEYVESLEFGTLPKIAGGGKFLCQVWSESDPSSVIKWHAHTRGPEVTPAETRSSTAQAQVASRAADYQAAQQVNMMPSVPPMWTQPSTPSAPQQSPGPWSTPWGQPGMPGMPYPFNYYQPQPSTPREDDKFRALEQQNQMLQQQVRDEQNRRMLEDERRRHQEAMDRLQRDVETKLAAEREARRLEAEAADRRHRELLGALQAQQAKPAQDPAEVERRFREEMERRLALQAAQAEQLQRQAETRREIEQIRADSTRQAQELQQKLADAQRATDASAIHQLSQQMINLQAQTSKDMMAVVERFRESERKDPLDMLVKYKQALGGDDITKRLAESAIEIMQNPGSGPMQMVGEVISGVRESAESIVRSIVEYKAGMARRNGGGGARQVFSGLRQQQRQRPIAEPRNPNGLNGAPRPANGTNGAPANGAAGVAPAPATETVSAETPAPEPVEAAEPKDRTSDEEYFGPAIQNVKQLRDRFASGKIQSFEPIVAWMLEGYVKLTEAGLELECLDDMEDNPAEFVKRLLPMAPENLHALLAEVYPPALADIRKQMEERQAEGGSDEEAAS